MQRLTPFVFSGINDAKPWFRNIFHIQEEPPFKP